TPLDEGYDWTADVMNPSWDDKKGLDKLNNLPEMMVCDALLDQHIFSGSGNIIKNEVLFRIRVHREGMLGQMPVEKLKELIQETVHYSHQFYTWRKAFELKKHWCIYNQRMCPRDNAPVERAKLGKTRRRSFYCPQCQIRYG